MIEKNGRERSEREKNETERKREANKKLEIAIVKGKDYIL